MSKKSEENGSDKESEAEVLAAVEDIINNSDSDIVDPETEIVIDKASEHLEDLQRLQAEYVNYKRRVDRDRKLAREIAMAELGEAIIPVLDDIELARHHGDLAEGTPFYSIAEKLEKSLAKYDICRYGEEGALFDPNIYEAVLQNKSDSIDKETVDKILRPGYKIGDRILRAAQVSVLIPEEK